MPQGSDVDLVSGLHSKFETASIWGVFVIKFCQITGVSGKQREQAEREGAGLIIVTWKSREYRVKKDWAASSHT